MTTLTEGRTTTSISKPDRPSSQRERLTAVQSSALHALRSSIRRLTVLAPTGSGKTYLFALCALQVLRSGGRILLLSASRACADEVSSRYLLPLAEEGYRTTATEPGSMQTGQFDAGATVYESALMALPGLVRAFRSSGGMVFFDDLEVARSRERGPSVEAVLRAFLQVEGLRLVFMSAVMQADDPLVNWLGGTVVAAHQREVELKRGVWRNGVYSFEEFNTALRGSEDLAALPDPATGDRKPSLIGLAVSLVIAGENTLVFVKDRPGCRRSARLAASSLRMRCEPQEIPTELEELPHTSATALLLECASQGVAFHNSDLTTAERAVVEKLMRRGDLRLVFATPTLASGVNFPFENVLVESHRWEGGDDLDPLLRRLTHEEFENCAGRCARLGMCSGPGRAILAAAGEGEEHLLWDIITASPPASSEVFCGLPCDRLFALLHGLGPVEEQQLAAMLNDPRTAKRTSPQTVRTLLEWLRASSLAIDRNGKWRLSKLGALVAHSPFCAESGATLCERLADSTATRKLAAFCWMATGLREFTRLLPSSWNTDPVEVLGLLPDAMGLPLEVACRVGWDEVELRRLKAVAALVKWQTGAPLREIEETVQVSAGTMERLERSFRSLLVLSQKIAKSRGDAETVKALEKMERPLPSSQQGGEAENKPQRRLKVRLGGQGRDRSGVAIINNTPVRLRLASYEILEKLVEAAAAGEGWVKAAALVIDGDTDRARKYLSQLRQELRPFVGGNPIENDGDGCYRLAKFVEENG